MSNPTDKRSVHTDALETLGSTFTDGHRDAIHIAVEPLIAGEVLHPGQHIGIKNGKASSTARKLLGIVDPFIKGIISEGEQFWMLIYPRTITSLRHVWEHPDFAAGAEHREKLAAQSEAESWLRQWCTDNDVPDFETVMAAIEGKPAPAIEGYDRPAYDKSDGYITFYGRDAHAPTTPEFWEKVAVFLDRELTEDDKVEYFSCSC